ncbi:hypothetical protein FVE85_3954 [Porphyridium purpureum]|uniref:Uncharacterized protein n=1 Tax=Porphyridium purpureum TaxID=35688 RepID=A0A5J4YR72_PORPP|nr:hypothetical protein FVE85_3954 [Porphyridium purpureum]|eukprot:POR7958..scf229_5
MKASARLREFAIIQDRVPSVEELETSYIGQELYGVPIGYEPLARAETQAKGDPAGAVGQTMPEHRKDFQRAFVEASWLNLLFRHRVWHQQKIQDSMAAGDSVAEAHAKKERAAQALMLLSAFAVCCICAVAFAARKRRVPIQPSRELLQRALLAVVSIQHRLQLPLLIFAPLSLLAAFSMCRLSASVDAARRVLMYYMTSATGFICSAVLSAGGLHDGALFAALAGRLCTVQAISRWKDLNEDLMLKGRNALVPVLLAWRKFSIAILCIGIWSSILSYVPMFSVAAASAGLSAHFVTEFRSRVLRASTVLPMSLFSGFGRWPIQQHIGRSKVPGIILLILYLYYVICFATFPMDLGAEKNARNAQTPLSRFLQAIRYFINLSAADATKRRGARLSVTELFRQDFSKAKQKLASHVMHSDAPAIPLDTFTRTAAEWSEMVDGSQGAVDDLLAQTFVNNLARPMLIAAKKGDVDVIPPSREYLTKQLLEQKISDEALRALDFDAEIEFVYEPTEPSVLRRRGARIEVVDFGKEHDESSAQNDDEEEDEKAQLRELVAFLRSREQDEHNDDDDDDDDDDVEAEDTTDSYFDVAETPDPAIEAVNRRVEQLLRERGGNKKFSWDDESDDVKNAMSRGTLYRIAGLGSGKDDADQTDRNDEEALHDEDEEDGWYEPEDVTESFTSAAYSQPDESKQEDVTCTEAAGDDVPATSASASYSLVDDDASDPVPDSIKERILHYLEENVDVRRFSENGKSVIVELRQKDDGRIVQYQLDMEDDELGSSSSRSDESDESDDHTNKSKEQRHKPHQP